MRENGQPETPGRLVAEGAQGSHRRWIRDALALRAARRAQKERQFGHSHAAAVSSAMHTPGKTPRCWSPETRAAQARAPQSDRDSKRFSTPLGASPRTFFEAAGSASPTTDERK